MSGLVGNPITIEISGEQFIRRYYVYSIFILFENNLSVYIGQTGDNKNKTARPCFRRLMGHLSDSGGASDNQIYRYFARKTNLQLPEKHTRFSDEIKLAIENMLSKSTILMKSYPIYNFEKNKDYAKNIKDIEKGVLCYLNHNAKTENIEIINISNLNNENVEADREVQEIIRCVLDDIKISIKQLKKKGVC